MPSALAGDRITGRASGHKKLCTNYLEDTVCILPSLDHYPFSSLNRIWWKTAKLGSPGKMAIKPVCVVRKWRWQRLRSFI